MSERDFSNLEWYDNRFKAVDIITLQNTIAKAVSELLDTPLQCWISNVDYEGNGLHTAKFNVSIGEPLGIYKSEAELAAESAGDGK